jgi:hypothetical protein
MKGVFFGKIARMASITSNEIVGNVWVKRLETGDFLFLLGTVNAEFMAGPPVRTTLPKKMDNRNGFSVVEGKRI